MADNRLLNYLNSVTHENPMIIFFRIYCSLSLKETNGKTEKICGGSGAPSPVALPQIQPRWNQHTPDRMTCERKNSDFLFYTVIIID